jgi:hypothetical protein
MEYTKLEQEIIKAYGEQCIPHLDTIHERMAGMIAALLFAGNQGDNPLCVLNRAFENMYK